MSIKIKDAKTPLERADAIGNLIEQMFIANIMGDEPQFNKALELAREHSEELVKELGK